jgi:hypothetical protein
MTPLAAAWWAARACLWFLAIVSGLYVAVMLIAGTGHGGCHVDMTIFANASPGLQAGVK